MRMHAQFRVSNASIFVVVSVMSAEESRENGDDEGNRVEGGVEDGEGSRWEIRLLKGEK